MSDKIIVIGGGVNGVTTALTLQLLGFDTTIYTEFLVDDDTPRDPRFASLYPAASVIPHSVSSQHLNSIFPASLQIFEALHKSKIDYISLHRHFELYEFQKELPAYTRYLPNFSPVTKSSEMEIPHRPGADHLEGWVFDCFIAEWPGYMHQLYMLYKTAGGNIIQRKINPDDIASLPADIIVNCSGAWSNQLFDDPAEQEFIRGHLVHVPNQPSLKTEKGETCSYNYTPDPSIYTTPQGTPSDVYFYPINGKWILGGSRQPGTITPDEQWQGKEHVDTYAIDDVHVPHPIIDLNKKILENTFKIKLGNKNDFSAYIGYRHSRKANGDGLRLEQTTEYGKNIIHNYGHGGAGVTLSWGAALKILKIMVQKVGAGLNEEENQYRSSILAKLQLQLKESYLQHYKTGN